MQKIAIVLGVFCALLAGWVLAISVALGGTAAQSSLLKFGDNYATNAARPCIHPGGGWTIVDCSAAAAATSAALNSGSRYAVMCTQDSYVSFSTTADANDGVLPKYGWYVWETDLSGAETLSCLNVAVDGDCRYIECK